MYCKKQIGKAVVSKAMKTFLFSGVPLYLSRSLKRIIVFLYKKTNSQSGCLQSHAKQILFSGERLYVSQVH